MKFYIPILLLFFTLNLFAKPFLFKEKENLLVTLSDSESQVVKTALEIFSKDYKNVFRGNITFNTMGQVYIGTLGQHSKAEQLLTNSHIKKIANQHEAFIVSNSRGNLVVLGSDAQGTAYGILELSRLIGVSPWEWWADACPQAQKVIKIDSDFFSIQKPSVKYRGIFINDEDWGMNPWSNKNYEPSRIEGQIGHKTHERIFELLLRLRANTFWPAMHENTVPFFFTEGNRKIAEKYGIYIGTSHCEPMARNTNGEWKKEGIGEYNYTSNRNNIIKFWEKRVTELVNSNAIYTLGIRGIHDSGMLGAESVEDQKKILTKVLKDQRDLLSKTLKKNVEEIPQVLIPYKEILDVYNTGLDVPQDVTLMWCDDNYGYIRHFPNEIERKRKGGNGIYYHISYWGRPHDYLWLTTTHPALVYTQMKKAYNTGAKEMWILNVGDIKPAEYLIEQFLDMAWNIESIDNNKKGLDLYFHNLYRREFGEQNASEIVSIMNEYYRLAYIRKPEYMGNTRVEENDDKFKVISDLPFSNQEIRARLSEYAEIERKVKNLRDKIVEERKNCWFQLIEYPVLAASNVNKKFLCAQLARHGKDDWQKSNDAFDSIVNLTKKYNSLNNGKWNYMMDYHPRNLPVFQRVSQDQSVKLETSFEVPVYIFNGEEYSGFIGKKPICHGLGYDSKAISLAKGSSVYYELHAPEADSIEITIALVPLHPIEGDKLCYEIKVDNERNQTVEFQTEDRSEEWKLNVLRNQAIRKTKHKLDKNKKHSILITAPNDGIIIDQVRIK